MRGIVRQALIAVIGVSLALPALAGSEIMGFGKAQFGQSVAEVKKIYPKMEQLQPVQTIGAQTIMSDDLVRFVIKDTAVPGLPKPTNVELRFWKDKLWAVIVYFPDVDPAVVIADLTKRLGTPNGTNKTKPGWNGTKTSSFIETDQKWYSTTDNALSKDAQAWFLQQVRGKMGPAVIHETPISDADRAATEAPTAVPTAKPAAPAK